MTLKRTALVLFYLLWITSVFITAVPVEKSTALINRKPKLLNPADYNLGILAGEAISTGSLLPLVLPILAQSFANGISNLSKYLKIVSFAIGILYVIYIIAAWISPGFLETPVFRSSSEAANNFVYEITRNMNDVDVIEKIMQYLNIKDRECQKRGVCEVGEYLVNRFPLLFTIGQFFGSRIPALAKYSDLLFHPPRNPSCGSFFPTCPNSPWKKLFY
ncbi:uncharacterized protein LOC111083018 [Limulus polyphemus]|uniref:Uncharacterized protein LOC111083018 n=1 Tax=Limulus polyphemus TaxID=6850 RepID=A0ABM1SW97_LIMPO|nr:uncharacterized protein LOC111083018 [Limulus polyphemus]